MDKLQKLTDCLNRATSDARLTPLHLAIYLALCNEWIANQFHNPYNISRRKMMEASRIRSRATYHKVITELKSFGYLRYSPSYHPVKGSSVNLTHPEIYGKTNEAK